MRAALKSFLVTLTFGGVVAASTGLAAASAPPEQGNALAAATVTTVATGLPTGTSDALVNLTMLEASAPGFVTGDKCSALSKGSQTFSNGNFSGRAAVANLSVVPLDFDGSLCLFNSAKVQLVADVIGSFAPVSGGHYFVPQRPIRALDSRSASAAIPGGSITKVVTGAPTGTLEVMANITMIGAGSSGYITADQCSVLNRGPHTHSEGNHPANGAVANLAVVRTDSDGSFCIYNQNPVGLVVDVQGRFVSDIGLGYERQAPLRVLDSRTRTTTGLPAGSVTQVLTGAPTGAEAVLANLTMVGAPGAGFITADTCSTLTSGVQRFSNGNHAGPNAVANLSVIPVDAAGMFCIYNSAPVQVLVDVQGSFKVGGGALFFPSSARRVLDTRSGAPSGTSCTSVAHIGDLDNSALDSQLSRAGVTTRNINTRAGRAIVETSGGVPNARDTAAAAAAVGAPTCWVFGLGTTDAANVAVGSPIGAAARIDRMMAVAGNAPVVWVNVRTARSAGAWSNANMTAWNLALNDAAGRYGNLRIVDWAAASGADSYRSDGLNLTDDAAAAQAKLIADTLYEYYVA
jgi:hypothetical protein